MTSTKSHLDSLPQKRMGAGCLFFDEHQRVLLVKPTYKPGWEIPGGIVEFNESPKKCCEREVLEEIGLQREIGALLVVDYNSETTLKTEALMFIFSGGVLSADDIAGLRICSDELSEWGFFSPNALPAEMSLPLQKRVRAAYGQFTEGGDVYFENQGRS